MKKIVLISCLFSSWVAFTQEEEIDLPTDNTTVDLSQIEYKLDEITNGYYSNWSEFFNIIPEINSWSADIANNMYPIVESLLTLVDSVPQPTDLTEIEYKLAEIVDGYYIHWDDIFRSLDDHVESIQSSTASIDLNTSSIDLTTQKILTEIEGNEDRENLNSSNIQAIKDNLEYLTPGFDTMVSTLANIESNTSYGDINYNNEDLINYLDSHHFGDFYTTFHGYTDAFVPTYLGYMSWSSFGISGNQETDTLRAWRPESISYDNFFVQVAQYLDNLANMSANANKTQMMIFDSIKTVDTEEEKQFIENKVAELQAEESRLRAAFESIDQLQENINFEKFEEYLKFDGSGNLDISMILTAGQFYDEIDLGFFPSEWHNRPTGIGNLYVKLTGFRDEIATCRDIFKVVYLLIISFFILWIVNRLLPVFVRLFTTLKAILIWK